LRQQIGSVENIRLEGINKRNSNLKNQGYVDSKKHKDYIRFLSLNPWGFGPDNDEKMEMMVAAAQKLEIDGIILSSPDRKLSTSMIDRVKRKFKKINKEIDMITLDSRKSPRTEKGYLLGEMANILIGRIVALKVQNFEKKDSLGRWSAFRLESNNKILQIFNVYWIPESTAPGILKSRVQYDQCTGTVKTLRQYRDELITVLIEEIRVAREGNVRDFIIVHERKRVVWNIWSIKRWNCGK